MSAYTHPVASASTNVYVDVHNTCLIYTPAHAWCSQHLLKCTPHSPQKNHMRSCIACAHMQRCRSFFTMEAIAKLSWVLREHRAGCRLPPALAAPPAVSTKPVAQRCSLKKSKSMLAHDAVAAAVSHKHHSIIRVDAGLIQFVYGSHSHLATELTNHRNLFSPCFA